MVSWQWLVLYGLLGVTTLVNIIVPFSGSATITPLFALLTNPHRAIGIASFFFFFGNIPRLYFFRKHIDWREVRILLVPSTLAAFLGALALVAIPARWLLVLILAFCVYFFFKKLQVIPGSKPHHLLNYMVGLISGFLQGTGLAGSDLRNQYLYSQELDIAEVHGTSALIGGSNFLIATIVRLYTNQLTVTDLTPLLYLFPLIVIATWLGKKALFKLSKKAIDFIIISIMAASILLLGYKIFIT